MSALAALSFAACASSTGRPTVTIAQTSAVVPLRASPESGVPVDYRLEVTNPLDHEVTLKTVEIETVGLSGAYTMRRVKHAFESAIPAHGSISIPLRAWVQPLQESEQGDVSSPVMLRGIARFESMGQMIQTSFASRVR